MAREKARLTNFPTLLKSSQIRPLKDKFDVGTNYLGNLRMMPKNKEDEFISTREAAKMLGISLSSVARYFDKGILIGEKNPITNWRYVSRKSVLSLMKKYGMEAEEGG